MGFPLVKFIRTKPALGLWLTLFLALFLRLAVMDNFREFTFDELVSAGIAERPVNEMWNYLKWEMHPPLHYYLLHAWMIFFGSSVLSVRLMSLIVSLLALAAFYCLAKRIFNSAGIALAASFALAISPLLNFYFIWARMYGLTFLLAALSFVFYLKLTDKAAGASVKKSAIGFYLFFTLAAIYTHLTCLAIPLVQLLHLLLLARLDGYYRNKVKTFVLYAFPLFFLALPWLVIFAESRLALRSYPLWYFHADPPAFYLLTVFKNFIYPGEKDVFSFLAYFMILAAFGFVFFNYLKTKKRGNDAGSKPSLPLLILLAPAFILAAIGLYETRFFVWPSLGLFIILAYVFLDDGINRYWRYAIAASFILVCLASFRSLISRPATDWAGAAEFIKANETGKEKIITPLYADLLPLAKYYDGRLKTGAVIDDAFQENDLLLTVVKTNVFPSLQQHNVNALDDLATGFAKIFFVFTSDLFPKNQEYARDWLISNGWEVEKKFAPGALYGPEVWQMARQ
ncbi:MAG: glycosyltransferase family 39 protein [Planctomycetes bacterium]|nr:glycosyltransferase family 39 protein [Planctomycetota bacterium]